MDRALSAVVDAESALRLAAVEPRRALDLAADVLRRRGVGPEAVSVAERARGIAHRELLDVPAAARHLRAAVRAAARAALPQREGEARLSLALEHLQSGRPRAALRELDAASALVGDAHAQVHNQLSMVYVRLGRYAVARAAAERALAVAERDGDRSLVALVLGNRGITAAYCGDLAAAEADLRRAVGLCEELGEALGAADSTHNLAWVLARRGDLPAALELYDRAERAVAALDVPLAPYQLDRCEALLAAGLAQEALVLAGDAAAALTAGGMLATVPEALLLRARAALALGDPATAEQDAARAARALRRQGRRGWTALAVSLQLQAAAARPPTRRRMREACESADLLRGQGWPDEEVEARTVAARAAELLGDAGTASAQLRLAAEHRSAASARTRSSAWYAEARLRARRGERAAALRAAAASLHALRAHHAVLGSTELHAAAAAHAGELGRFALELALTTGRPATVLAWTERLRATTLQRPPLRPPDDAELAADLSALRAVEAEHQALLLDDELPPPDLLRRRAALQAAVRRRSHHARGAASSARPPALADVRALLDDRRLVSFFDHAGRLGALVVERGGSQLVDVGPTRVVEGELRQLSFSLRRAATGDAAAGPVLAAGADRLGAVLRPALGRPAVGLVVVPTGPLHAVPWSLLPDLRGCPVEVAPSVGLWARPSPARDGGDVLLVAGPGLRAADDEVRQVGRAGHADAVVLQGDRAGCADVLAAMGRARVAHLACHAVFRSDNPLFSCLLLADGPLTVYDLEGLGRAPDLVVLSACDSGRSGVRAGDELLGLAAALFALGTRTLVASVVPVGDAASAALMASLHASLAAGRSPARALAEAQVTTSGSVQDRATAAAFVCLRAGVEPSLGSTA